MPTPIKKQKYFVSLQMYFLKSSYVGFCDFMKVLNYR